jgi:hypothetical protein
VNYAANRIADEPAPFFVEVVRSDRPQKTGWVYA